MLRQRVGLWNFSRVNSLSTETVAPAKSSWKRMRDKKFIDWKRVRVSGGVGGDGCVSFRREAFAEFGGPDGGCGGNGGSVLFVADQSVKSLSRLRNSYRASPGGRGQGGHRSGKKGEDIVVRVPIGTMVKDSSVILADLSSPEQRCVVACGGAGGTGNASFARPNHQSPMQNTPGEVGEERVLEVELKTLADIGMVGFPNAGKSTLLRALSRASPAVAAYPFTTLNPHVGIMEATNNTNSCTQIAVADIPGLLPGAHRNVGLGHSFLRHIERCHSLLYIIDCAHTAIPSDLQLKQLKEELHHYRPSLLQQAMLVVANKMDLEDADKNVKLLAESTDLPIVPISGLKKWNINTLKEKLCHIHINVINK